MRLIRSKGVGVYFVTQNPLDVPDTVLAQLGNRVQHALRAYTPREQKAVKAAADTFRPNPDFDARSAITELGVGEALVSTLEDKGVPSMVQRTLIRPPSSRLGPVTPDERRQIIGASPIKGVYEERVDRNSARERLGKGSSAPANGPASDSPYERHGEFQVPKLPGAGDAPPKKPAAPRSDSATDAFTKSLARSLGTIIPRILDRILRGRTGRPVLHEEAS